MLHATHRRPLQNYNRVALCDWLFSVQENYEKDQERSKVGSFCQNLRFIMIRIESIFQVSFMIVLIALPGNVILIYCAAVLCIPGWCDKLKL